MPVSNRGLVVVSGIFRRALAQPAATGHTTTDGTRQKRPRPAPRGNHRHGMRGTDEQDCDKKLTGECDDF